MTAAASPMLASATAVMTLGLGAVEVWTMVLGSCVGVSCGVVGCYLVLRRMSMLGDAITHAILPGLVVGFVWSGSRGVMPMLAGAAVAGVLTAVMSAALVRVARVAEDASLGVVFTGMFALGVVGLNFVPSSVDLDPGCVLYGSIETAPLRTARVLGVEIPDTLPRLAVIVAVVVAVIAGAYKEVKIVAFDPALAATMGISAGAVHYGMMGLVAASSVASFEAVGSVLVVAMLIAPGATAHLLTDRLGRMFVLAGVLGVSAAVMGYLAARWLNVSVAGMMSVAAGGQFALAALGSPRHGIVSRGWRRVRLALRIVREDALGMLYRWHEHAGEGRALAAREVAAGVGRPMLARVALRGLRRAGLVERAGDSGVRLTAAGIWEASGVIRSHRLWERYLAERLGLPLDHVHAPSHRAEHYISAEMQRALAREVGEGADPHGRPIPGPMTEASRAGRE